MRRIRRREINAQCVCVPMPEWNCELMFSACGCIVLTCCCVLTCKRQQVVWVRAAASRVFFNLKYLFCFLPHSYGKNFNFTRRWSFNLPGWARNACEWWHNVLDWNWHQPFVFQRCTRGVITNTYSSLHPVKNRTNVWASFSRPSHAGTMCNFNCAIGSYDHPWFEKRLASSIAMPHAFTQNSNLSLLAILLPLLNVHENTSQIVTKICFRRFGLLWNTSSVNN